MNMDNIESQADNSGVVFITAEGYERLQKELDHLTQVKRAEIAHRLRESMDHGEFSEDNNELGDVKLEQAIVENRIADLRAIFAGAQVLEDELIPTDKVGIGSHLTVRDLDRNFEFDLRIVSSFEADPDHDWVSNESPMGHAVFGHAKGDVIEYDAPAGKIRYEVVKIWK